MKYVFNEAEFVTLLVLGKIKKLYSFELDTTPEDSQIVNSVYSLYKAGFVTEEDGRMIPEKTVGGIISAMADARFAVKLTSESTALPSRLVYFTENGKAAVLYRHLSKLENELKLELVDVEDFIEDIIEDEISECVSFDPDEDEELIEKMRELDVYEENSVKTVFSIMKINTVSEKIEETLKVNASSLYARIVKENADGIVNELYTDDRMRQYLFEAFGRR